MPLDRGKREDELVGDRLVGGGRRVAAVIERPRERDQHPLLRVRKRLDADPRVGRRHRRRIELRPRGPEQDEAVAEAQNSSPSMSRRRPATRSPLTYNPLRDSPSSEIVHSPAINSISACSRDTCSSVNRRMSTSSPRPTVIRSRPSRVTICGRRGPASKQERNPRPLGSKTLLELLRGRCMRAERGSPCQ